MKKHELSLSAGRQAYRFLAGAALVSAALGVPQEGNAATARVRWGPGGAGAVIGYRVYVRNGGSPHVTSPQWSGNPAPATDGSMSALVTYTPVPSEANYFAVVAVSTSGSESELSGELPTGTPNPCRADSCSTKTSCDFSNHSDGISCDDASFCDGPEVCLAGVCDTSATRDCTDALACTIDVCDEAAGTCTHVGSLGCCPACDVMDPCLADACAQGDCAASPGTEIAVNRIRFRNGRSGTKLTAKGTFMGDPSIDPSLTGALVELRTSDGVVLYSSSITAQSIKPMASGRHYRFVARRSAFEPLRSGLERLDFRRKDSTWLVTARATTPELMEAFLEPTITWMIRLGPTCVRRLDMACDQKGALASCR